MIFHRSLSDSKSLQISRTALSILADLNSAEVWMVSIRPLISKPSSPHTSPLVTVPSAIINIMIIPACFYTSALTDDLPRKFE